MRKRLQGLLGPAIPVLQGRENRLHVPLPQVGRWIELTPVPPSLGRGPGWEGRVWPSGESVRGSEWEVMTWVQGRVGLER